MAATTTTHSRRESDRRAQSRILAMQRRVLVIGCDLGAIVFGLALAGRVAGDLAAPFQLSAVYGILVWAWMAAFRLYNARLATHRGEEFARIGRSGIRAMLMLAAVAAVSNVALDLRAATLLLGATTMSVAAGREGLRVWFARRRRAGHGLWASILVAGEADGRQMRDAIDADRSSPHTILEQLDPRDCATAEELLTRVLGLSRKANARGVVIVESSLDRATANSLVRGLLEAGLSVDLASNLSDISTDRLASRNLGPSVATWIEPRPRGGWRGRAKRLFDLTITVSALLVLAPVFATVALLVKLSSPGPVFFRQERVGRGGEPFDVLKFRSMVVNAEELLDELVAENEGAGPLFKMKADPRVTRIGRSIRKTSLDELPQLINVLRNEMSLVGPRPALKAEMAEWDSALYARLQVKPGITGMWQVSGRSGTSFAEYTRLDLYYVHNWSLLVDLSILFKTIPAVLKSDGAF
ncbi:MAG: sugar transferase [Acidimicrobiales bacterium]